MTLMMQKPNGSNEMQLIVWNYLRNYFISYDKIKEQSNKKNYIWKKSTYSNFRCCKDLVQLAGRQMPLSVFNCKTLN